MRRIPVNSDKVGQQPIFHPADSIGHVQHARIRGGCRAQGVYWGHSEVDHRFEFAAAAGRLLYRVSPKCFSSSGEKVGSATRLGPQLYSAETLTQSAPFPIWSGTPRMRLSTPSSPSAPSATRPSGTYPFGA